MRCGVAWCPRLSVILIPVQTARTAAMSNPISERSPSFANCHTVTPNRYDGKSRSVTDGNDRARRVRGDGGEVSGVAAGASKRYDASMRTASLLAFVVTALVPGAQFVYGQQHPGMPAGMTHEQHLEQMKNQSAGSQKPATPDHMAHRFEKPEEWAKSFDDPARDEWQMPARVIEALQLTRGMSIADIGAGTGYFTVRLAKSAVAPTVFAVDIEPAMIEHVQKRALHEGLKNVRGVLAASDGSNLPEPVDVVLMVDTYHHIPNRVAYFTALKAKLKPGGRLAVIDFRKGAPEGPPEQFRFTSEQISAELAKAGFALQTSHEFLPRQMFLVYRVN